MQNVFEVLELYYICWTRIQYLKKNEAEKLKIHLIVDI